MLYKFLLLFVLIVPSSSGILWSDGFQHHDWTQKWNIQESRQFGMSNTHIINDPVDSKFLRVSFPKKSYSPSAVKKEGVPLGGAQFLSGVGRYDSLHLRYYLRFAENFDFVKGGKIPGLSGGTVNSGGNIPTGTDGFSARLMWRAGGEGEVYGYLPTSQEWGTSIGRGNFTFPKNKWVMVEEQLVLNDPDKSNGKVRLWVDEKLVIDEGGFKFRTIPDLKIDVIFFSTFFGGSDNTWATPNDTYIDFDNFAVSESYIGKKGK
jgi:hypothetical protein